MVWSTINIWSQCFVNCLAIVVLTCCAVGCDSGAPPAAAPKAETSVTPAAAATPTTADASKGKPKAEVLGGDTYDFGSTEVGQQFEHVFEIKNVGTADLTLEKGQPSCSTCTSFEVDKLLLKPNEIAKATVKWHVKSENPQFRQYAPVKTNDPDQPDVKMHVVGKIVKRIVLEPVGQWSFGDLVEGQPKEFIGTLTSAVSDTFVLESVTSPNPRLKFSWTPMSTEKLTELKVKKGFHIKAELSADVPVGQFSDTVTVKVLTPEPIALKVDAVAKRSGPLQIFGPGWHEERMQLALSAFDPKEPLVTRLFMYTRGVPDELKVVKVVCPDDRFSFELKPDTKFKGQAGDHRRYELFVKVAPSNREAVYTALKPLKVELETNQEKVKQIKLKITCSAIP